MTWRIDEGDCMDLLRALPDASVHALVTDPPYVSVSGGNANGRTSSGDSQFYAFWLRSVMAELRRVLRPDACGFVFCDWRTVGIVEAAAQGRDRFTGDAWGVPQALVWDREAIGLGSPFRNSFEMIAFMRGPKWASELAKDIRTVLRFRYPYGRHEHHPAEKPVDLVRQLVEWAAPEGGVVLDPFAGSGTTGVAAIQGGRGFIGMEIDPDTRAVALRRLRQAEAGGRTGPPILLPTEGGNFELPWLDEPEEAE